MKGFEVAVVFTIVISKPQGTIVISIAGTRPVLEFDPYSNEVADNFTTACSGSEI